MSLEIKGKIEELKCIRDAFKMLSEELIVDGVYSDNLRMAIEYALIHRHEYRLLTDPLQVEDRRLMFQVLTKKEDLLLITEEHIGDLLPDFIIYGYWGYKDVQDTGKLLSISSEANISKDVLDAIFDNKLQYTYTTDIMAYLKILEVEAKSIVPLLSKLKAELSTYRLQELLAFSIIYRDDALSLMTKLFDSCLSEDCFFEGLTKGVEGVFERVSRRNEDLSILKDKSYDVLSRAIILEMYSEGLWGCIIEERVKEQ